MINKTWREFHNYNEPLLQHVVKRNSTQLHVVAHYLKLCYGIYRREELLQSDIL